MDNFCTESGSMFSLRCPLIIPTLARFGVIIRRHQRHLMRLPGVIFDLDGTLTKPVYDFKLLRKLLNDAFPDRFGAGTDLLDELDHVDDEQRANSIIHDFEEEGRDRWRFNPGAIEMLQWLDEQEIPRAVITRNSHVSVRLLNEKLELRGVQPFAEHLGLGREFKPHKPAPDSALHICKLWKMDEEARKTIWFIGDGIHDIQCAISAGITACLVRNAGEEHESKHVDHTRELETQKLHQHVFDDMTQILAFFRENMKKH